MPQHPIIQRSNLHAQRRPPASRQRRKLLRIAAAAALTSLAGTGLSLPRKALATQGQGSPRRLVLVELMGANDGLNTLVPWRHDLYRELRPRLALGRDDVVDLDADNGLHAAMTPLMEAWDHGEFAWVQGLGYPSPNRSHFTSIALWETGGDGQRQSRNGWMTEALETGLPHAIEHAHGISMVADMGLFESTGGRYLSIRDSLSLMATPTIGNDTMPLDALSDNPLLDSVSTHVAATDELIGDIAARLEKTPRVEPLDNDQLGAQLADVLHLIRAGIDTPVYRVRLDGFDTHERQWDRHWRQLARVAVPLAAFREALIADGEWDNTIIMSYSEFGRRARENLSGGTDHGTAAPHFVIGGRVRGGLHSEAPDLEKLEDDDLVYTTDYRSLYDRMLTDWLGIAEHRFRQYHDARLDDLVG